MYIHSRLNRIPLFKYTRSWAFMYAMARDKKTPKFLTDNLKLLTIWRVPLWDIIPLPPWSHFLTIISFLTFHSSFSSPTRQTKWTFLTIDHTKWNVPIPLTPKQPDDHIIIIFLKKPRIKTHSDKSTPQQDTRNSLHFYYPCVKKGENIRNCFPSSIFTLIESEVWWLCWPHNLVSSFVRANVWKPTTSFTPRKNNSIKNGKTKKKDFLIYSTYTSLMIIIYSIFLHTQAYKKVKTPVVRPSPTVGR